MNRKHIYFYVIRGINFKSYQKNWNLFAMLLRGLLYETVKQNQVVVHEKTLDLNWGYILFNCLKSLFDLAAIL